MKIPSECSVEGCERRGQTRGMCQMHYKRLWRNGDLEVRRRPNREGPCEAPDCEKPKQSSGLCSTHYSRMREHGTYNLPDRPKGTTTKKGYRQVTKDGRSIRLHRWVMQQYIGRALLPQETVHHKNGDRLDNRIENLELWSSSHPAGQRVADKVEWAKELLRLYEPDALREV